MKTPVRRDTTCPRQINTVVSKVPLRAEAADGSLSVPRKRSRSLSAGPPSTRKFSPLAAFSIPKSRSVVEMDPQSEPIEEQVETTVVEQDENANMEEFPSLEGSLASAISSPSNTPRRPLAESAVLGGVVAFVDVHTTEGADASGIFVELLTQMGAKCVKNWSWNPRASINAAAHDEDMNSGLDRKIGITHVVYKDGGKRTLEKVRDAGGVVKCVGVGWVLDCERENQWLDESQYSVDISIFPRGGSRRRKSMEPRALINDHGNLLQDRRSLSAEMTSAHKEKILADTQEDDDFETSKRRGEEEDDNDSLSAFSTPTAVQKAIFNASTSSEDPQAVPATPTGYVNYDPSCAETPTTPYFMNQGSKMVQQTCPPKQQTGKGLFFPVSGEISDLEDAGLKKRLEAARRKSLGWRPRVASPLGR